VASQGQAVRRRGTSDRGRREETVKVPEKAGVTRRSEEALHKMTQGRKRRKRREGEGMGNKEICPKTCMGRPARRIDGVGIYIHAQAGGELPRW